ncbi:Dynactin subunit 1 [Araneus ventricosus]|uniref:Dynactin subunit 1 n=2 Tax=Araneus ventricosus TaxID=182803 RepID=A0A4Y2SF48_ARAVE|nr:Dynactin subunit 1 [Araneus ventricosus]GBN86268.1 Dynactin subunit 1 [Araneus ventricosus]GBN86488.1 Dynactin subunit 1 [Araneus ventricosus]GBN86491.1 Dynactin subunit 1 [Araneus ventricosus]
MSEKVPKVGSRVEIIGKDVKGKVAFAGNTNFSAGKWFGVILDEPKGKNNGCVQGKTYFTCPDNYGIFVRQTQLQVIDDEGGLKGRTSSSPSTGSLENVSKDADKRRKSSNTGIPRFPSDKGAKDAANLAEVPSRVSSTGSLKSSMIEEDASVQPSDLQSIRAAASTLEYKGLLLQKDQEIDNLKSEIKDLTEKLETIKIKRQEDQTKLKEAEKAKIQVQQLLEYKAKIAEVQADLQRQITQAKKEAKDAIEAKEQHAEEMSDLAEAMEIATLDKEMAEEKCEALQSELEQTKEKMEELQIDYEILKTEMSDKGSDGKATTYQVKQLEQQNERLKEALVKLRDLSAQEKQEQQRTQKELEHQKSEINELSRAKEKLSLLVEDYEKQLGELKEQVDAALGSEEMIELLTERNLALEDRVKELQVLVDDLERLQDVNDQLQESAKETELELREEIDMASAKMREAQRKLEVMQEAIADYEQTIQKFRDQTEQLREANHELHMQLQKESDRVAMSKPVEYVDFKVKYAENKAFARAVEMDLRRLEVQEATQHVNYLCAFMPDSFLSRGSDHDAISVLLLVPRMITKSEILASQVKEKFPSPEEITKDVILKSHKIDQYAFSNRLLYQLYFLQSLLHQYVSALSNCNVELFMKVGTLYIEMAVQEKALDYYIDLLRKDQLDENVNLDGLNKCVMYFFNLYSVHLASERVDCSQLMGDYMRIIGASCESIRTDISSIKMLLDNAGASSEFGSLLKDVCTYSEDVLQFVKKIRRRLPAEGGQTILQFSEEVQNHLLKCRENVEQVMSAAYLLRKSTVQQIAMSGDSSYVSVEKIKELAHESTDKAYGKDDSGPECLRQSMNLVMTSMNTLSSGMQEGEYEIEKSSIEKGNPPVFLRAQSVKEEARDLENLKFKLEAREGDILELKKALKIKSDELSEMHVRKEMAEKKLEIAVKDGDERVDRIQRQLDEAKMSLKKKEKEFEETLDHLQADIDALETERGELKDKIKLFSKKAILEGLSKTTSLASLVASPTSPTVPGAVPSNVVMSRDTSLLSQQVQDLQLALKHLKNENLRLQTDNMMKQLASLPPLKVPSKPTGLVSTTGFRNMINLEEENTMTSESLVILSKRSKELLEKAQILSCPNIVDISHRKPGVEPAIEKMAAKNHIVESTIKLKTLQNEVQKLKVEIANLRASQKKGTQIITDFSAFPTPEFSKTFTDDKQLVARIAFPKRCGADEKAVVPLLTNMHEIIGLHSKILS